jgi:hypothetical protein
VSTFDRLPPALAHHLRIVTLWRHVDESASLRAFRRAVGVETPDHFSAVGATHQRHGPRSKSPRSRDSQARWSSIKS